MANIAMVAGWQLLKSFRDVEERANKIGLKFAPSKYSGMEFDTIALMPLDEHLPVYNREAEIFAGTLQDIDKWLRGVEWARNYDDIMKVSTHDKRQTAESKYQQRELLKVIREGEKSKGIERV
jgi:hypothetical protein